MWANVDEAMDGNLRAQEQMEANLEAMVEVK
jgi:hypothetical protein